MRTLASIIALFFITLALSGCGGDSGCGHVTSSGGTGGSTSTCGTNNPPPGTGTSNVGSLTVTSSTASIPADGSSMATITVLAKDANNNAMGNVGVTLSASSGTLSGASATTAADGTITATLAAGGAASGTAITVTATSGSVTGKATVNVVATQRTITLLASSTQMPSNNSAPVTITAIVRGANNQLLPGVPVSFSTTSGAIAAAQTTAGAGASPAVPAGTTDASGQAQAMVSTPADPTNRNITVTATLSDGTTTANVNVAVIGTTLTVTGPTSLILGSAGPFNVSLTNSGGTGIAGQTVTLKSALSNTLSASTVTTDNTGHATFTLTGVNSGSDTVSASSLGISGSATVAISSQNFSITAPAANTTVNINTQQTVTVVWLNANQPVANAQVTLATTRGTFVGGTGTITLNTDATGTAQATISSATAGPALITATGQGVTSQLSVQFAATTPSKIDVQASPSTIATSAQSTITAIVWDAQNNLVQGQTVYFQLTDQTGGTLSAASAVTDSQGRAQTVYTATSTPSAANGVTITGTVGGSVTGQTSITVGGQSVFLSLATGNHVGEQNNQTQFVLPYTVTAVDAAGHGVSNVTVSLAIHSFPQADVPAGQLNLGSTGGTSATYGAYAKGTWQAVSPACNGITGSAFCQVINSVCYNEDVDSSGILKSPSEDINGNGKLDPGDAATVTFTGPSLVTDSNGNATFNVVYPEDHAGWIQVKLTASATVSGTESSTTTQFWLPMLAIYINSTTNGSPPGTISPYGTASACNSPQ